MTNDLRSLNSQPFAALLGGLILLLVIACGGGDDNGANGADGTNGPDRTDGASATLAETGVEPTLVGLSTAYLAGVDGKVTYRLASENFGEHPNLMWSEYRLGEERRTDWGRLVSDPQDDPINSTIVIVSNEGAYVCTTSPGYNSCSMKTPGEASGTALWQTTIIEVVEALTAGVQGAVVTELPNETIAGVKALCFDLDIPGHIGVGSPGSEKLKICFAADGALLLMSRTVTFTDTAFPAARLDLEATKVTDASPSDFEPPASPSG